MTEKLDEDAWRVYERWKVYLIIIILICLVMDVDCPLT